MTRTLVRFHVTPVTRDGVTLTELNDLISGEVREEWQRLRGHTDSAVAPTDAVTLRALPGNVLLVTLTVDTTD